MPTLQRHLAAFKKQEGRYERKILRTLLYGILMLLAFSACKRDNKKAPLARVGDKYLYVNDLKAIVPKNMSPHDSILLCKSYINKWVHTQLMVQQAEKSLSAEKLNFDKQLEEYRNSLITYQYETEYVKQHLDTVVEDQNIELYYQHHLKDFELKENIVKVVYAILDKKRADAKLLERDFQTILQLPDSLMLDSLDKYAPTHVLSYSADTNSWIPFGEILRVVPIETYNQQLYLKNHRIIYLGDENKLYLLKFVNFKIKDETSPLELESKFIRSIILNKRKTLLVSKLRKELFVQAGKQNDYEIY